MKDRRDVHRFFEEEDLKSPISEAYRTVRTNLQFTSIDRDIRTIVFSSTKPKEGKSTVSFNLASSLALTKKKVLLIDADLRKPRIHQFINSSNYIGLTSILSGDLEKIDVLNQVDGFDFFHCITSGPIPPNPSELLSSKKMYDFLKNMEDYYDYILIDAPPIGLVADAVILSTIVDGVILVAGSGEVKRDELLRSKESFEKVNAHVLGVILNRVSEEILPYGYYDY